MNIYIDIDNTICKTTGLTYDNAEPDYDAIAIANSLYDKGHTITYWTARGTKTGIDWYGVTKSQLNKWNVKYNDLKLGKPAYDLLIDDKALNNLKTLSNIDTMFNLH